MLLAIRTMPCNVLEDVVEEDVMAGPFFSDDEHVHPRYARLPDVEVVAFVVLEPSYWLNASSGCQSPNMSLGA